MKFFAFSLKEMQDFVKKETIRGVIYGGILWKSCDVTGKRRLLADLRAVVVYG
jgi:hypothetical protein